MEAICRYKKSGYFGQCLAFARRSRAEIERAQSAREMIRRRPRGKLYTPETRRVARGKFNRRTLSAGATFGCYGFTSGHVEVRDFPRVHRGRSTPEGPRGARIRRAKMNVDTVCNTRSHQVASQVQGTYEECEVDAKWNKVYFRAVLALAKPRWPKREQARAICAHANESRHERGFVTASCRTSGQRRIPRCWCGSSALE